MTDGGRLPRGKRRRQGRVMAGAGEAELGGGGTEPVAGEMPTGESVPGFTLEPGREAWSIAPWLFPMQAGESASEPMHTMPPFSQSPVFSLQTRPPVHCA